MKNPGMYQNLSQFKLSSSFRGRSAVVVQFWWLVQNSFFAWSPQFMYGWRRFLLRLFGAKIGKKVLIRPTARVTYPWKLQIGDSSWIGDYVELYTLGNISIGTNTVISQRSYLCTGSHDSSISTFDIFEKPIHIGNQVWLATDVFIAPGITIGDAAVIGTRSTVLSDMPEAMICYGNPAKPIKPRVMKPE